MKKVEITLQRSLDILQNYTPLSSTELAKHLGVKVPTAWRYLIMLVKSGHAKTKWIGRATRYSIVRSNLHSDPHDDAESYHTIVSEARLRISESFATSEGDLTDADIEDQLVNRFAYIAPAGHFSYGISAFVAYCQDPKRSWSNVSAYLSSYLEKLFDISLKRRKHWLFDGTESMKNTIGKVVPIAMDRVLFCEVFAIFEYGRTRTALELFYGKQNSSSRLLKSAISRWIEDIREYLRKHHYDAVIFVPPTIVRRYQFRDILQKNLHLDTTIIPCEKHFPADSIRRAQKDLRGNDRIINATETNSINTSGLSVHTMKHIIIFDDNFTTGATMNAIAQKIRAQGFMGCITAITLTGQFVYDPKDYDDGEI